MTDADKLLNEVCRHGLGVPLGGLTPREQDYQRQVVQRIIDRQEGVPFKVLLVAARYGMRKVWPFTEEHRPYDAVDLEKNILKAKAAAMMMITQGIIPMNRDDVMEFLKPPEEE